MVMTLFTVDLDAKLFVCRPGVTSFDVKVDLYNEAKLHWITDNDANKRRFPFNNPATGLTTVQGGPDIDPASGTSIPTYVFLENGWRVRPDEANHTLGVTGGVLLVQGGGDPFADTLGAHTVRVNYQQPVQAIAVGVGGATAQEVWDLLLSNATTPGSLGRALLEIWRILALDGSNPLSVNATSRIAGDVSQTVSTVAGTTTVTRDP